ncbi:hypothetical protein NHQ30_007739 [Ciborinia camelliae]|nr:hypothetical protein NHQ30_007739 [Ciborinia camelliae]
MLTKKGKFGSPELEAAKSIGAVPFLLPDGSGYSHTDVSGIAIAKPARTGRKIGLAVALHAGLILLYSITSITLIVWFHDSRMEKSRSALPDMDVKYHSHQYSLMRESPFVGPPSPSVDEAWHTLLSNMSIRVSDKELSAHSLTSVALPDGGNLAWVGVFHELHCVKMLQQANYHEYYHHNVGGQELRDLQVHVGHCIGLLRATVMCRPYLASLTTFVWREGLKGPLLAPERPVRQCVNWDVLMGSIRDRVVAKEELERLKNPLGMADA